MQATRLGSELYHAIVDATENVVLIADKFDNIISANLDGLASVFGYSLEDIVGTGIGELLPEMANGASDNYLRRRAGKAENSASGFGYAISGRHKDGRLVPLNLSITEGRSKAGARHFTWMMRDITPRLRLDAELRSIIAKADAAAEIESALLLQVRASNQELKVANDDLQKFTSIVAHDLRGPLRRIEAFIGVLKSDFHPALNAEGVDILDRIAKGSARMKLMLDSLLEYSRYNSNAIAGKTANLADVVDDALSAFDMAALGVDVLVDLKGASDIKGDPVLLSHVLQNLIGNAVKFRSVQAPVVRIEVAQLDREIRVSVIDNGIGIEARFADKIFDMFYRLHDEEEYEGSGIGLTVCRKIVNDHRGRIWLDTTGQGETKFVFTVWAASEADLAAPKPPERPRFAVTAAVTGADAPSTGI